MASAVYYNNWGGGSYQIHKTHHWTMCYVITEMLSDCKVRFIIAFTRGRHWPATLCSAVRREWPKKTLARCHCQADWDRKCFQSFVLTLIR